MYTGSYGSSEGVKALTRHISYGGANAPTEADLERWLTARAAQLTGWLQEAGYVVPVTLPSPKAVLDRYADYGAAADAEAAQRAGGYSDSEQDRREVFFAAEWVKAEAWIKGGALAAMGVPVQNVADDPDAARPAAVGQITAGTAADPRCKRVGIR